MVHYALAAAERLARDGIDVEVIDPRSLAPFDETTLLQSVAKTGRLVVADEAPLTGGLASSIAGLVAERGFWSLKAPIARVARADTPVPYSPPLEKFVTPDAAKIEAAVRGRWRNNGRNGSRQVAVMAGFVPAIHVLFSSVSGKDARMLATCAGVTTISKAP